jgi:uncharacterized protein (DUF2132 family)
MDNAQATKEQMNDPLHGVTLEKVLVFLVDLYGWETLGEKIRINCFNSNPSIKSSLAFLRKTPWARKKVEDFYVWSYRRHHRQKARQAGAGNPETE